MNTKNLPNFQTFENNQVKITKKSKSESCNLEHIFRSRQNKINYLEENETDEDSHILYMNDLEDIEVINIEEENENENENNIFKKLKKCHSKKKNKISSQCWHLIYKDITADKQDIINSLKKTANIPVIDEYIIANIQSDTHVFLKFISNYSYNKKVNDDNFKYDNIVPVITPCKYWTEIDVLLKDDEKNYITNIDKEKMELARKNKSVLNNDVISLVDEGLIDIKELQQYIGAKRMYKEIAEGKYKYN